MALLDLGQPFGVEAKLFGHLEQLLRSLRILDGFSEPFGAVGLVSVVIGLGHGSTFLDRYKSQQKGSITKKRKTGKGQCLGRAALRPAVARFYGEVGRGSNSILSGQRGEKTCPLFVLSEQKESQASAICPLRSLDQAPGVHEDGGVLRQRFLSGAAITLFS
jgi:hypothetical protein